MEYTKIEIMVPKGYEQAVMNAALMKIEGILSQLILAVPTTKKTEFEVGLKKSQEINKLKI